MKVGFDVDDVLCDLLTVWLNSFNVMHGTTWTPEQMTSWWIITDIGCTEEQLYEHLLPTLYLTAKPHNGALETVRAIREMGHQVEFLTSCPDYSHYIAKIEWLRTHGFSNQPEIEVIPFGKVFAVKKKIEWPTDYLLDDAVANVDNRPGGILLTCPHNRADTYYGRRVHSLQEFVNVIRSATAMRAITTALPTVTVS